MPTPEDIPSVEVLKAITPSAATIRAAKLEYGALDSEAATHARYERDRMHAFWGAETGSIEEQRAAKELASQYMLMGASALNSAYTAESRELWSRRYTQASTEMYGEPNVSIARSLAHERETGIESKPFEEAASRLRDYLNQKYSDVFAELDLENSDDFIGPEAVAQKFESALGVLAETADPDWAEWEIERNPDKDSLSVVPKDKKIIVGLQRADVEKGKIKGLLAHEILVHGQRCVNGSKVSQDFARGLAGYLDAEEGLGVFVEYAINGEVSEKNIDRYLDIAYALGTLDGTPHTREEALELALARAKERSEAQFDGKSPENIEKEVYAHVNRIYRGSLGNEHVGVFSKDIAYHKGFLDMGQYISDELSAGKNMDDIMKFLLQGKFDPTNAAHLAYIEQSVA